MGRPATSTLLQLSAVLLTPAWIGACSPTATYGTGEAPERAVFREVTGGFLSSEKKEPIDYQPRAPLVLPPSAEQLPPPAEPAATASADWPIDPNERIASIEGASRDPRYGGSQAEYRRLKPLAGALPEAPRNQRHSTGSPYDIVHSKEQQQEFRKAVAEAKGYGRKERRYLTEPPDQYREPAATAPADFEDINGSGGGGWFRWLFGRR